MEIILFAVSGISMVYYVILVVFTDATWSTQTYWPVSALIFVLIALVLRVDRKRKQEHKKGTPYEAATSTSAHVCPKGMPLELRTAICTSCGLYFVMIGIFAVLILLQIFSENPEDMDYLIFIENGDVETTLTQEDYNALNCTIDYMTRHEDVVVVLAGCSRFRDMSVDEAQLQDLMKNYLLEHEIGEERIITEAISSNLKQNITYSYAYILVDWYGKNADQQEDPAIGIVAEPASIFRYRMLAEDLGNLSRNMDMISFQEPILVWPARIVEEIQLIIKYHLIDQFEWL